MIKIIDDFLPINYINAIEELCYRRDFPWIYCNETVYETRLLNENLWEKQFVHQLFNDGIPTSEHYKFFMPIMFLLEQQLNCNIKQLMRLKINLLTTIPEDHVLFLPHIDSGDKEEYLSAILYINDSDGDTIIYENNVLDRSFVEKENGYQNYLEQRMANDVWKIKKQVEYKKNRLVVFDGSHFHEARWPTKHKDRIVLNIVFKLVS